MKASPCVMGVIGCVMIAGVASPARGIIVGTKDNFEDMTVQDWLGATTISNLAGGPAGAADRFLNVQTSATSGTGSHLATKNSALRWNGDYITAGVTAITVDLQNRGTTALEMRMVLFGLGNRWTSTSSVSLAVGSGWQHVTFPISPSALTRVLGTGNYTDSITNVNQLMFRHDTGTPSSGGATVNGTIGIDNITAVPAPGGAAALAMGGTLALRRRRREG